MSVSQLTKEDFFAFQSNSDESAIWVDSGFLSHRISHETQFFKIEQPWGMVILPLWKGNAEVSNASLFSYSLPLVLGEAGLGELFEAFDELISAVEKHYAGHRIDFKLPPEVLENGKNLALRAVLEQKGYQLDASLIHSVIPIYEDSKQVLDNWHPSQLRHKKHWENTSSSLNFNEAPLKNELKDAYTFIWEHRNKLEYPISIGLDEFLAQADKCPRMFQLASLTNEEKPLAVVILVRVSSDFVYAFLPADDGFTKHSPLVGLYAKLIPELIGKGIKYLDLGSSLDDQGKDKPSLSLFKERLGARLYTKPIYWKQF